MSSGETSKSSSLPSKIALKFTGFSTRFPFLSYLINIPALILEVLVGPPAIDIAWLASMFYPDGILCAPGLDTAPTMK